MPETWFTLIVKYADDPESNYEEQAEGIPDGFGYLEQLLSQSDFRKVHFVVGLVQVTIMKMEEYEKDSSGYWSDKRFPDNDLLEDQSLDSDPYDVDDIPF